ncbi:MAG: hypothetical protein K1X57_18465 [Gemmataceae bacterium]|nr:hypothetical protein [Gemmataceae bacterium]
MEVDGCVFDAEQLGVSNGYESLDPVGREAFVNHRHFDSAYREAVAERLIASWAGKLLARWPRRVFRIYRQIEPDEVTVRFHMVRPGVPNWCEDGIEILMVGGQEAEPFSPPTASINDDALEADASSA